MVDSDLKNKVEALLFSSGRMMGTEELSKLIGIRNKDAIDECMRKLKKEYEERNSPLFLTPETDGYKLTVREAYLPLVRSINPHTELSKTVMETLAVISWKNPILQSTVIRIRTNKAYDHIAELEEMGFVTREKYGRTYMLKLTQKFFEYFDLKDINDIRKLFKGIKEFDDMDEEQLKVDEFSKMADGEQVPMDLDEEKSLEENESAEPVISEGEQDKNSVDDHSKVDDLEVVDEITEIEGAENLGNEFDSEQSQEEDSEEPTEEDLTEEPEVEDDSTEEKKKDEESKQ